MGRSRLRIDLWSQLRPDVRLVRQVYVFHDFLRYRGTTRS